ncbi:hypothetical protein [Terrabacter sp. C0L_2]|uniref:hypothetical protein n=1 Tax=Terrabacter sp. C0L_2 TaxID=3108389 RepID=UPI002ED16573|nr:hypothetical protein U5C87_18660 [Terrabacter sp. C0L_2]
MDGDTRGPGSRVMDGMGRPPRRLFALGAGAAALAVLVDRGLRLDVPPPPPPVPTRRPAPDEALLLHAVADLSRVVAAETSVLAGEDGGALVRQLRTVSREQLRVLRGRLTNAGVPTAVIAAAVARGPSASPSAAPTGTPTPGSTATPTTSGTPEAGAPVRTRTELAALLDSLDRDDWAELAAATAGTRDLLAAAWSERLAGAVLLGREVALASPSTARPAVVARTQPLVYAFEVVAAQSVGDQRQQAEDTLEALVRLEIAVSGTSSTTPAGWALPHPVTSPDAARRLATETLSSAVDASTELMGTLPDAAALEDVARWSAHLQALAVDWRVPLTAFPGASA